MPLEISAGVVIYRKSEEGTKYLILHYASGHWDFVKGNIERTENEKNTVIRELKEETGIENIRFVEGFREEIGYFYRRNGKTVQKKVIFYLAETETENVTLSYEHIGYEWLDYDKALERLTFKNAKEVLEKARKFTS